MTKTSALLSLWNLPFTWLVGWGVVLCLLGVFFLTMGIRGLRSGRVMSTSEDVGEVSRDREPVAYWICVATWTGFGVILVVVGLSMFADIPSSLRSTPSAPAEFF